MSTPHLQLETLFALNSQGHILSTREPSASHGPAFSLIRSATSCAWAIHVDVPKTLADTLDSLAREEPPVSNFQTAPLYADKYLSLVEGEISSGPAFVFSDQITPPSDANDEQVTIVEDERLLARHFSGWKAGELTAGRSPMLAILDDGYPVSICYCARGSDRAVEAGVGTARAFRGRGYASSVTAAWALAIRASGRIPLYSTSWDNKASRAVARKVGLIAYASDWSISP